MGIETWFHLFGIVGHFSVPYILVGVEVRQILNFHKYYYKQNIIKWVPSQVVKTDDHYWVYTRPE